MNLFFSLSLIIAIVTMIPVFLQLRSHPRGLFILFFAEMWERFSYYGMRSLLIFYLTQHFLFSDSAATLQYGAYTTLIYLVPLIGGVIADRYLGNRKAVAFGALLLVCGHMTMAIEGRASVQTLTYHNQTYSFLAPNHDHTQQAKLIIDSRPYDYQIDRSGDFHIVSAPASASLPPVLKRADYHLRVETKDPIYKEILFFALSLITLGVGYLKPSISSIVGELYGPGDPRRDPGFTLYYYGINLGAFFASVLCGWLGESFGWGIGFGAAGVGMLLGFCVFLIGRPWLNGKGEPPDLQKLKTKVLGPIRLESLIYILSLFSLFGLMFLIRSSLWVGTLILPISLGVIGYVFWWLYRYGDKKDREKVFLGLLLVAGATLFWTLFEQSGSSLNLFAERNVNLNLVSHAWHISMFGKDVLIGSHADFLKLNAQANQIVWINSGINASQTQALNSGFVLMLVPLFAILWTFLERRHWNPHPLVKFGLALIQVGLAFIVLLFSAQFADDQGRTPLIFLVISYFLQTTGELCLSPIGLSQMTKLAPKFLIASLMSIWFLATALGEYIGGFVASLTGSETVAGIVLDPKASLVKTAHVFGNIGIASLLFGLLFLVIAPRLKRWSHDADVTHDPVPQNLDR